MNRQEKIKYLEDVKAGKIQVKKFGFGVFLSLDSMPGEVFTPNGKSVSPDEAKRISEDYQRPIFVKCCGSKSPLGQRLNEKYTPQEMVKKLNNP